MLNSYDTILERLNSAQRDAVTTIQGPLLVLAGPGSGKTRVITHRIAYLLGPGGVPASSVLAVTFTKKAAREMVERLHSLVPSQSRLLLIGTFHSICSRFLRQDGEAIGVPRTFTIADADDQERTVRRIVKELNWDEKRNPPSAFLNRISAAKSHLIGPDEFRRGADSYVDELAAVVYQHYQEELERADLLDFDDLIMRTVHLFQERPDVLLRYQERYQHILVDEFQDTNLTQFALIRLLGKRYRNVCVVGDEDQSVYSWRQADIRNILNFESDFPEARQIVLEQNYRSTQTIIQVARAIITPNRQRKDKRLFTENERGERIFVFEGYDENEEAQYVATQIERLFASGTVRYRDVAVMYRTNSQSRVLEKTFLRHRLPHKVVGMRFYERKEIRDLLAYLRVCHNPNDAASLERIINIPARDIGAKSVADLRIWASRANRTVPEAIRALAFGEDLAIPCPLSKRARTNLAEFGRLLNTLQAAGRELVVGRLIEKITTLTGYQDFLRDGSEEGEGRWENVRELITVADEFSAYDAPTSLTMFIEDAALAADADEYDNSADAVTLITLHAAKGLEFDVVFIVGLEEGLCPHNRAVEANDVGQLEEERRLLYVGVTRARQRLYLTYANRRTQFGTVVPREFSRFFQDVPPDVVFGSARAVQTPNRRQKWVEPAPTRSVLPAPRASLGRPTSSVPETAPATPAATTMGFKPGDRVVHAKFGEGIVVNVEPRGGDSEVTVAFNDMPIKRLLASYANLRRL